MGMVVLHLESVALSAIEYGHVCIYAKIQHFSRFCIIFWMFLGVSLIMRDLDEPADLADFAEYDCDII
jgi:hypothetical protein